MSNLNSQSKEKYHFWVKKKKINFAEFNLAVRSGWIRRMIFSDTKYLNLLEAELKT